MEPNSSAPPLASTGPLGSADGAFVIVEWEAPADRIGPTQPVAPFHVHHRDDEAWYVLDGALGFRLGDREVEARAGSGVFAPRGVAHTYWNAGPGPARYLLVMTPALLRLIEELHAAPLPGREAVETIFRKYDSELF